MYRSLLLQLASSQVPPTEFTNAGDGLKASNELAGLLLQLAR